MSQKITITKECKLNNDLVYKTENLDTILQEADKDFEDFYWETGKYNGRDLGIDGYKDFIHSQITKVYELGQEGYLRETPLKEIIKNIKDEGKNQTINQIKEWANSVSFNGLIDKDVLIQFLSKTK